MGKIRHYMAGISVGRCEKHERGRTLFTKVYVPVYNLDNILKMRNAINIYGCHVAIPVIDCKCK